jgi:ATP-dependent Lhr-like helicase
MRRKCNSTPADAADSLSAFNPAVQDWFGGAFPAATPSQQLGWPPISRGESTLILAPTGSGKTLAAFLWCINRLMFEPLPAINRRCRILYVSPLKALAVDVERNLRSPIVGIANMADLRGLAYTIPQVNIRTGDTPALERARFQREPLDILITTPESLYLLLTSNSREALRAVDTAIVDEIHALVPGKRGAHLALSLERLESLCGRRLQRIGLSATQRPLDEVARFLGGASIAISNRRGDDSSRAASEPKLQALDEIHREFQSANQEFEYRPVTIVNAAAPKKLELRIEVPVEDMAKLGEIEAIPSGPAAQAPVRKSIWTAIHPKLLNLVQSHRSTLIFVNSRRLAERVSAALNELAGETLVLAHHGSLALPQRREVEDKLKSGLLRGLVATSSLELGIDMSAIDLVIQIEAPPSIASGMQRIGRGSHQVGATSRGVIFPKYRADLVAAAAATRAMHAGEVEATRYPRNPLDVLAQQIVAMVALDEWAVDELYAVIRRAAPYVNLSRPLFESVLDLLAGLYPSDDFAELKPRITWDRVTNRLTAREGARRVAVINGGTIPDRGLYGVFLAGADGDSKDSRSGKPSARVGELDEEMVFESRTGETFLLGASTWRIEEITHDRVLVSPAPGEPGKMPFWKGDAAGRPLEFGRSIGALVRTLRSMPVNAAIAKLTREHDLDRAAAENLARYLAEQEAATQAVPDDRTILIEHLRDELGDWRVCVLTPFGGRIHAPWSMAVTARIHEHYPGLELETMWTDDGFVVRFPELEEAPDPSLMIPQPQDAERLVIQQLGSTALFAAKFREAASRALLLPRRRPGGRTPLWHQRKRAADLLAVASRFGSFPIIMEAYRECLRDVFDIPALTETLEAIRNRIIHVATVDSTIPSPYAASLLFGYVANYIYEGDAPLPERRAQALAIDQSQLRDLLGDIDLREVLDPATIDEVESQLQLLDGRYGPKSADGVHDLLLRLGDLQDCEIAARTRQAGPSDLKNWLKQLRDAGRVIPVRIAGQQHFIAAEDAGRYRDALGTPLPPGIPQPFLAPVNDARADLVRRYARTHGPFTATDPAERFGVGQEAIEPVLRRLVAEGRLVEGEFRPGSVGREWCGADVLRLIRQRSLAKLRHAIAPVERTVLARLTTHWQGVVTPRRGLDALLDVVESLQGVPLPASVLEAEILPARIEDYTTAQLDTLLAAGEVVWCGIEPIGARDGRLALFLIDHLVRLWQPPALPRSLAGSDTASDQSLGSSRASQADFSDRAFKILDYLRRNGASFFAVIHEAAGGGFAGETVNALWDLVWHGYVTNDAFGAVRAFLNSRSGRSDRRERVTGLPRAFRSRRTAPAAGQGRWSLTASRLTGSVTPTQTSAALAQQLLKRYGVLMREAAAAERLPGGFQSVYPVLRNMEESGRIRRGFFVAGVSATQFAVPAALEMLRSLRDDPEEPEVVRLSATDPANVYGTLLRWPEASNPVQDELARDGQRTQTRAETLRARTAGTSVIQVNGALAAYLRVGNPAITVFLPDDEPGRSQVGKSLAAELRQMAVRGRRPALEPLDHAAVREEKGKGILIREINGVPARTHPLAAYLEEAGFVAGALGYSIPRGQVKAVGAYA